MSDGSNVTSHGGQEAPAADAGSNAEKLPVLCRETVLPRERGRGMAGIAIVCSMAGVASGLALAATLMAVQISDRPQGESRSACWRKMRIVQEQDSRGWLGVEFIGRRDGAHVTRVFSGTAAEAVGLRVGDIIRSVDGELIDMEPELQRVIRRAGPGSTPTMVVSRAGEELVLRPQLASYPIVIRY
jgi:hypothetical protein